MVLTLQPYPVMCLGNTPEGIRELFQLDSSTVRQVGIAPNYPGTLPEGNAVLPSSLVISPSRNQSYKGLLLPPPISEESLRLPPTVMIVEKLGNEIPDPVISKPENNGDQSLALRKKRTRFPEWRSWFRSLIRTEPSNPDGIR